nr:sigma-70 family RNA polymerase sigma factor [Pyrinomonadaceae bacterium]
VYRTAYALVRDGGLAEDIVQEVFLRLYRNLDDAPCDDLLRAWLLRVTINTARNTLRGRTRANVREESFAKTHAEDEMFNSPECELERQTEIRAAREALSHIREPMRSCLWLKQQGMSYREIAHALSLNEGSVGSFVARGRKEFIRAYGKIGGRKS